VALLNKPAVSSVGGLTTEAREIDLPFDFPNTSDSHDVSSNCRAYGGT